MKNLILIGLILTVSTLAQAQNLRCEAFTEVCRAAFCTGGFQAVDQDTREVVGSFRYWDHKANTRQACEDFILSQQPPVDIPVVGLPTIPNPFENQCTDFEWRLLKSSPARCTRSLPGRCYVELHGYAFSWLTPGGIETCERILVDEQ